MAQFIRDNGLVFGTDSEAGELIWTSFPSIVYAGSGNDGLRLGYQNDIAYLGDGDDTAYVEGGNDLVFGEAGDDFIYGGSGNDWLDGGVGRDFLWGGIGNDQLFGNEDGDTLYGVEGINALYGSLGNDLILGGTGTDIIFGGDDDDVIVGGDDNDYLNGGSGHNEIMGGAGDDLVYGSARGGVAREDRDTEMHYRGNDGNDLVYNFASEVDQLLVVGDINGTGVATVDDFADLVSGYGDATDPESDFGTTIDLGADSTISLVGVAVDDVLADLGAFIAIN